MAKEKIIGIDLGTSNSQAAVMIGGKPTIIPSAEGATVAGKMFPSIVAFTKEGTLLVGEPARRQVVSNPEGTVSGAKRQMGTGHKFKLHGKEYTPQQISAFILQKIKRDAEAFLGETIRKAVITVPAYFNDNQRQATKDAGKIAGLEVERLVNEPTAAAMAYNLEKDEESKILIFDLGGGTLDVTIMEYAEGTFTVLSTSGDTHLGGRDMDESLVGYIVSEFKKKENIDISTDKIAMQRVREAAEKAKIELSAVFETEINLPFIAMSGGSAKNLEMKITRSKLDELVDTIVQKCKVPVEQAIKDSKLSRGEVGKVILVGGPTRMPLIQKFVEEITGRKPERGVDPMECVALGAAVQGAILAGEIKDLVLLDVTPLTLGIETLGGVMTPIIERNSTIPIKKSKVFSTAVDMQPAVTVHVIQGERPLAKDNTSLGEFNLMGIPPAPRGMPKIEVSFDIDSSGILHVSAKDLGTKREQAITITASTKLSEGDIDKMVRQAQDHEEEDKRRKEEIEAKNNLDSTIYETEKVLSELGDKLSAEHKQNVEDELKKSKEALDSEDTSKLKAATEELRKVLQAAGASIYQQAAQASAEGPQFGAGGPEGAAGPAGGEKKKEEKKPEADEEKVVDAEYKVEGEEEKKKE
ncbi:MAG: molecular chaperone DnaK [Candidatus Aenigmarchaeota archaeon]|nr:molecular chaperone DnaK [Candidatus Aenigmarchaeota archaeon]